ncbi:MAG: hypothetical protein P0Y56_08480 [Candidatus Andeanibacterium colombiense]|uniref:DUF2946 domain-containing protein n=1 Tax=Candidatus Andeanibacterium colombiense TaxID=3121345 RepID=A0AAJ5X8B9_9SPHN|nr:MAG: hypothetical protein P0Y56_08480 [Sphingomonadaceae bacterium]
MARAMHALRSLVRTRRRLSLALVALALCMKALLPAGYMVSDAGHVLTVTICTGTTDTVTKQIAIPTKGDTHRQSDAHGKDTAQCPFSSLSMAATGGADAPLLALALAFILVLGFLPAPALPLRRTDYFQPPLRGPPATA